MNTETSNELVGYAPETFDIEHETGDIFTPNFIKKNNLSDLRDKVRSVVDLSIKKNNRSVVLSVSAEKGGVGKTTVSLAFAQLLRNLGFKVLIIDTDALGLSHAVSTSRAKEIHQFITSSQDSNTPEDVLIDKKKKLDPVVNSRFISSKEFNSAVVEKIAALKEFDVVMVDTAGHKDEMIGNFDHRKIAATDVPHITTAYVSDLVIIPMKGTGLDMISAAKFYLPVVQFLQVLQIKKIKKYNTVIKLLPTMIEKDGVSVRELQRYKEETNFEFFNTEIRRSAKIASTISGAGLDTLYTTNVAGSVLNSFFLACDEAFTDILEQLSAQEG